MKLRSILTSKVLGLVLLTAAASSYASPAHAGLFDFIWEIFGKNPPTRTPVSVPEPATLALFATGVAAMSLLRRGRKAKKD